MAKQMFSYSLLTLAIFSVSNMATATVVDTGQSACYDNNAQITCPQAGAGFYGQDAQYAGTQASYTNNGNGTVTDNVTGLVWQQTPDSNGDGNIGASDKFTLTKAEAYAASLNAQNFAGYNDWRLPTIKELYSLMDFRGTDPSGETGTDTSGLTPFIDTRYFAFGYGDTSAGERIIDAQFATSTRYVSTTMGGNETMFGVNFADGRIKGYPINNKTFYVLCVRGDSYGENQFVDNGNGTISDQASGLMWAQQDSGAGMNWEQSLAWAVQKNTENYLGYNDWRIPNAKELQSIVDYSRSPDTTGSAALNSLFTASAITNEAGKTDYPFYWSSTTHVMSNNKAFNAAYVAFGRALGYWNGNWVDVHGAGAQRSDPKSGNPADYPFGHGPQGDAIRIYNYARLVRDGGSGSENVSNLKAISTRGQVQPANVLTAGIIVGNKTASTKAAVKARGPSMNLPSGKLSNPKLTVYNQATGAVIDANTDWQKHSTAAQLQAAGQAPSNPLEAALIYDFAPGAYTIVAESENASETGTAIVEVYQIDSGDLRAISTRGFASTANPLIAGISVGTQTSPVFRGRGPSMNLPSGKLGDPKIALYDANAKLLDSNDNWQQHTTAAQAQAAGLAPGNALESALIYPVSNGTYTLVVDGANNTQGTAIVEVYEK